MKLKKIIWAVLFLLSGCDNVDINFYRGQSPHFDMQKFFSGSTKAWGIFQDHSGKTVKRFKVDLMNEWTGNTGTLKEVFYWDDGTTTSRMWNVNKIDETTYEATSDDAVGVARGKSSGNAMRWKYRLKIPAIGNVHELDFDDWMYMIDENSIINKVKMKKFGFVVGELTLFIHKPF